MTWTGEVFHCVCMTTDGLSPMRRMRLPFICGQLVDECVIDGQYGRVLWGRRAVRVHHHPALGRDEAFAFQYRDSCGDGAAYDAVSSLAGARAWELDAESVAAGTDGFGRFGGDSCCGWATHSSQSRTAVLDRLRGLGTAVLAARPATDRGSLHREHRVTPSDLLP